MQSDPRTSFFNEIGDMLPPFRLDGWRGCCIDPDQFGHPKMPHVLFEAVMAAVAPNQILLQQYTPDKKQPIALAPSWPAFESSRNTDEHWSLEYVLFDASETWAFLLDPDMLIFGAEVEVAGRVDIELTRLGTSLLQLTVNDYPEVPASSHMYPYIVQVLGADPWQCAI